MDIYAGAIAGVNECYARNKVRYQLSRESLDIN